MGSSKELKSQVERRETELAVATLSYITFYICIYVCVYVCMYVYKLSYNVIYIYFGLK